MTLDEMKQKFTTVFKTDGLPEAFFGFVKIRPVSMFQPGLDILPGVELLHSAGAAP